MFKKTTYMKFVTVLALVFGLFCFSSASQAAETSARNKGAEAFIQGLGDKAILSLTDQKLARPIREKRLREILTEGFDLPTIGKFAMGRYWKTATEAERKEYLGLFEKMVVQTYTSRFEEYSGEVFKVLGSMPVGTDDILVASQILPKDGPALSVDWRVRMKDGKYKVIDAMVEGISMSVTQRSDFASVIDSGGGKVEALIETLRKRSKSSKGAETPVATADAAKTSKN